MWTRQIAITRIVTMNKNAMAQPSGSKERQGSARKKQRERNMNFSI
jgi:hypothetical protein